LWCGYGLQVSDFAADEEAAFAGWEKMKVAAALRSSGVAWFGAVVGDEADAITRVEASDLWFEAIEISC